VLIVGFSQGAAAAVAFAARHRVLIAGLALLAGFVPSSDSLIAERPLSGLPTFLAYGTRDATIPPAKSREAIDLLRAAGATLTACDAPIGHKVSATCLRSLTEWATSVVGAAAKRNVRDNREDG
jgi:predicted esterase